ncbi:LysR family transcriptional regulator [Pseudomonas amygdali pv. tabaci str. ATCC 11528]|uniref:LysR family transcriptional regulator n=6 Tax=Pseudomonas syringae group genomosp. 2 TaxID=251698 RepID=A0AAX1VQZ0_PSEAJ|nr:MULTISPECIES: LysR family transcriptional regulator [Pseudomonas syringae group genomosp. 2]KPX77784.1 Transcriptional regulator, LysR family [Pseudomonas amygdali pv. lachrymans]KEZ28305.1 LysR family transcriptional regulator [Pseudomonas amygdali pv. tabaci str. 6605]KEZ65854.1 LysR family transcriptional regulator [Pseudomonas amygdali pv. tabaci str. ATCC 11528]KIY18959.1 LysR family transcriptional regulator [Pseudomonas amygdali pv. tabaci]KKY50400.1 LysR family transcriptional regul
MQISDIEVFAAIASSRSLSEAARRLGLSPMAISRRLAALENDLGVRLFHRTTRSVSLTPEGEVFLPHAKTILEASEAARTTLKADAGSASGVLRVTAPSVFGQTVIMPLLPALMLENPALSIDLTLSDSIVDIAGLGIDVAIRIATIRDSALVARSLAPNPRVVCVSPDYLARHGKPALLEELRHHPCIALHAMPWWSFTRNGEPITIRAQGPFSANSVEAVRTACKQGIGLAMLTYWDVRQEINEGSLQQVDFEDAMPEQLSVTAVLPTRQRVPHRVRLFIDRLEAALKSKAGAAGATL